MGRDKGDHHWEGGREGGVGRARFMLGTGDCGVEREVEREVESVSPVLAQPSSSVHLPLDSPQRGLLRRLDLVVLA